MAKLKAFRRIIIQDHSGRVEYDSGLEPSNSFVIAFLEHLYGAHAEVNVTIEDRGNTPMLVPSPDSMPIAVVRMKVNAPDDEGAYGLVVGTGTAAEANTDYKLATKIDHGTGAGQLDHGAHNWTVPAVVGSNVDMVVSRSFYNGSGSSITVREIGIFCRSNPSWNFLLARDVLSTPTTVNHTQTLTLQYTLRTTV